MQMIVNIFERHEVSLLIILYKEPVIGAVMKSKKSILIIEDDPPLKQTLALMFRQEGYTVVSTSLNLNPLVILDGYPFDLIVLDLNQNCDNCLSLFFKIKRNHPLLTIILLSTNSETEFLPCFEEEKAWMIIRKPFEPCFLIKSVRAITGTTLICNSFPLDVGN